EEETNELKEELRLAPSGTCGAGASPANSRTKSGLPQSSSGSGQHMPEELRHRLEEELGDMFFVLVNIARYLSVDPESALKKTNRKFKRRFQWMEARLHESGRTADQASMDELESLWQQAKVIESAEKQP